jgi:DNA-binding GntR family transcriptional regulator
MNLEIIAKEPGQSIKHWVYEVLRSNIIKLHLKPGLAISESEIAETLNVSRTPIREAFIRLVEDGLLEIYPQKGSLISLIDIEQAEEARFVRRVLDKAIIREACEHFAEDCLFDLSANLEMQKFCGKEKNYERMFVLDNEFHRIIYRGCGKERIWVHIKKMAYNFDRLRILRLSSSPWEGIINEHSKLTQFIIEKNPTEVDETVDQHLTRSLFDKLAIQYPEYFKQNIHEYLQFNGKQEGG